MVRLKLIAGVVLEYTPHGSVWGVKISQYNRNHGFLLLSKQFN